MSTGKDPQTADGLGGVHKVAEPRQTAATPPAHRDPVVAARGPVPGTDAFVDDPDQIAKVVHTVPAPVEPPSDANAASRPCGPSKPRRRRFRTPGSLRTRRRPGPPKRDQRTRPGPAGRERCGRSPSSAGRRAARSNAPTPSAPARSAHRPSAGRAAGWRARQRSPALRRNRNGQLASSDSPATISNCGRSRCQPMPAPGAYSIARAWRKSSGSRPAKAATLAAQRQQKVGDRRGWLQDLAARSHRPSRTRPRGDCPHSRGTGTA
jgi:hypothetical protein